MLQRVFRSDFLRLNLFYLPKFWTIFQYYEMSYGLNVEMHKQVSTLFFFLNVTIHSKHPPSKDGWAFNDSLPYSIQGERGKHTTYTCKHYTGWNPTARQLTHPPFDPLQTHPSVFGGRFFFTRYGVLFERIFAGFGSEGVFGEIVKSILTVYVAHSGYYRNYSLKNSSMARAPLFSCH